MYRTQSTPSQLLVSILLSGLTPESLIRALRQGEMYASSGVTVDDVRYDAESGQLELDIRPDGDATFTTQFVGTTDDYDASSEPVTDGNGEPVRTTRKYSADVGRVLAETEALHATYQLTGRELYVRAVVTSSRPHANPSFEGQRQQAWTQPVGWEKRLSRPCP